MLCVWDRFLGAVDVCILARSYRLFTTLADIRHKRIFVVTLAPLKMKGVNCVAGVMIF